VFFRVAQNILKKTQLQMKINIISDYIDTVNHIHATALVNKKPTALDEFLSKLVHKLKNTI